MQESSRSRVFLNWKIKKWSTKKKCVIARRCPWCQGASGIWPVSCFEFDRSGLNSCLIPCVGEMFAFCSEIETKHLNTLCGPDVDFFIFIFKPAVTWSDRRVLKCLNNGWRGAEVLLCHNCSTTPPKPSLPLYRHCVLPLFFFVCEMFFFLTFRIHLPFMDTEYCYPVAGSAIARVFYSQ
jgi:hypothetical protein